MPSPKHLDTGTSAGGTPFCTPGLVSADGTERQEGAGRWSRRPSLASELASALRRRTPNARADQNGRRATRATWIITLIGFILFNKILFNIIVTPALPCGGAVRMMPTKRPTTNKWGGRNEY
jgi:hypothetical protein